MNYDPTETIECRLHNADPGDPVDALISAARYTMNVINSIKLNLNDNVTWKSGFPVKEFWADIDNAENLLKTALTDCNEAF